MCDYRVFEKQRKTFGRKLAGGWFCQKQLGQGTLQGGAESDAQKHLTAFHSLTGFSELFSKPKLESSATLLDQGESLDLWCSVPGAPPANFTIQKEDMILSQAQNFTKKVSAWDSGTYTCVAGIGKVVKKSNAVQITVCGEYILTGLGSLEIEWEKGNLSPAATLSSLKADLAK